jgi:hypothetical protein
MSSFNFIIDNIRFSFSALTTYETCHHSYKLTYLDKCERENNFYGQYGNLIHDTMFQYFAGNLDVFELSGYFMDNYVERVNATPPPYPIGAYEIYKESGLLFFDNFSFDKKDYDILMNEEKIDFDFDDGIQFVAKPDLVLYEKATGEFSLVDYKTSAPFKIDKRNGNETVDKKKLDGYYKQMYIYTYALRNYKFIPIDKITLWFTRPSRQLSIKWNESDEGKAIQWLEGEVDKIKKDEKFIFNNSSPFFCNTLCSVRESCEFRPEM